MLPLSVVLFVRKGKKESEGNREVFQAILFFSQLAVQTEVIFALNGFASEFSKTSLASMQHETELLSFYASPLSSAFCGALNVTRLHLEVFFVVCLFFLLLSSAFPCPNNANQKHVLIGSVERSSHVSSVISTNNRAGLHK